VGIFAILSVFLRLTALHAYSHALLFLVCWSPSIIFGEFPKDSRHIFCWIFLVTLLFCCCCEGGGLLSHYSFESVISGIEACCWWGAGDTVSSVFAVISLVPIRSWFSGILCVRTLRVYKYSFVSSLPILIHFISFCSLIAVARASFHYYVEQKWWEWMSLYFSWSSWSILLVWDCHIWYWLYIPSIFTLLRVLTTFCILAIVFFCICWGGHVIFVHFVNLVYHFDLWILNHPCIFELNPS